MNSRINFAGRFFMLPICRFASAISFSSSILEVPPYPLQFFHKIQEFRFLPNLNLRDFLTFRRRFLILNKFRLFIRAVRQQVAAGLCAVSALACISGFSAENPLTLRAAPIPTALKQKTLINNQTVT